MKVEQLIQIILDAIKGEEASADFWFDKGNKTVNFTVTFKEGKEKEE